MTEELKQFIHGLPEKRHVPDRRSPGWYEELVEELNKHADRIDMRVHRFIVRGLVAFSIIAIATAVSLVGFAIVLRDNGRLTDQIQTQRANTIRNNCLEQNARHANTVTKLIRSSDADIRKAPSKAAANEVRRRRDVTVGLIDALVPVANCDEVVDQAVREG